MIIANSPGARGSSFVFETFFRSNRRLLLLYIHRQNSTTEIYTYNKCTPPSSNDLESVPLPYTTMRVRPHDFSDPQDETALDTFHNLFLHFLQLPNSDPHLAITSTYLPFFAFFTVPPFLACGAPIRSSILLALLIPVAGLEGGADGGPVAEFPADN